MISESLEDHITRVHGSERGAKKNYAAATGKTMPQVSRYLKNRYWVIDGELYGPIKSDGQRGKV